MMLGPRGVVKLLAAARPGPPRTALGGLGPDLSLTVAYAINGPELFGTRLLTVGLLTRMAVPPIIISVIIAVILWPDGYFWTRQGYEYTLLWNQLCLAILIRGSGRYSIDPLLPRKL